jgi:4-hydroxyphenylacetate 3-monooxygenase
MIKTGEQHIASLCDGREIYLDGERVDDVTTHPAFRGAVASIGRMFDFQSALENRELMTFETDSGTRANRIWELPASYDALVNRRKGLEAWTELHAGFMGRAPDHVASCISGMYMGLEVFEAYDANRARALSDYYRYARDNDLYLTYVIINPAGRPFQERRPTGRSVSDGGGCGSRRGRHHGSRCQNAGDRRHYGE